jgi:hypothetical protein
MRLDVNTKCMSVNLNCILRVITWASGTRHTGTHLILHYLLILPSLLARNYSVHKTLQ